jgi:hypothetical protein
MSTDDELNEELGSYGYKLDTFALKDGNYQVNRLDGYGGYTATFQTCPGFANISHAKRHLPTDRNCLTV